MAENSGVRRATRARCPIASDDFDWEVVVASPRWVLNGVNVFSEQLVRGLIGRGVRAHLLLTGSNEGDVKPLPLPTDVPIRRLPVEGLTTWHARWDRMIGYLYDRAPCIYIPNHDYAYSCVASALDEDIAVVGVVHSDDPQHYAHARELGRYWNATVAVSQAVRAELFATQPAWDARLNLIHHGVEMPEDRPHRPVGHRPLRIVYVGRLVQQQKRILDLPEIMGGLKRRGVAATLTVIGGGADREALESGVRAAGVSDSVRLLGVLSHAQIARELREHDVSLLTSDFEGLPLTLLEAMAAGCVPIVTSIRSGIPDVVEDFVSGFIVPVGAIEAFVDRLTRLHGEPELRDRLSAGAFDAVQSGGFTLEAMTGRYVDLFQRVAKEVEGDAFRRPRGEVEPLSWLRPRWRDRIPPGLRRVLSRARRILET